MGISEKATLFHRVLIKNLKFYRKQYGISQSKLAELCSVSPNYIGEIEMGRKFPSAEVLTRLVEALNVRPSQLFLGDDERPRFCDVINYQSPEMHNELLFYVGEAIRNYNNKELPLKSNRNIKNITNDKNSTDESFFKDEQ
jgi:transcriptional regulator with XRE-family HTH domain